MRTQLLALALVASFTGLSNPASADTVGAGYTLESLAMPSGVTTYGSVSCTLPGGDLVTFDGTRVDRWTPTGAFLQNLGVLATGGYSAFLLPKPDGSGVVFAHSGDFFAGVGGELFEADFGGGGIASIVPLSFPYDAAFASNNVLIVSADLSGTASSNNFVRVDLTFKTAVSIGQVSGPSGPLALRANGDLYYAPADPNFPAAPGSGTIVSWSAATVAAGGPLGEGNWSLWSSGYDPIGALVVDPDKDRIYVAENLYNSSFALVSARVRRARPLVANAEEVAVADEAVGNLEFVDQGGAANFQAYQPGDGLLLKYNTSNFFSFAAIQTVRPKRPTVTASGPGTLGLGSVTLSAVDAPVNGTLYLVFGPQANMTPTEQAYANPGYLFHTYLAPGTMRRLPFILPTDANGEGSFTLYNDGSLTGLLGYQFLVGDGAANFLGATNVALF